MKGPQQFGEVELWPLETGRFRLDGGAMFGVVPKPLWSKQIPADDRNRITLALRCLLLRVGERLVLVDSGMGELWSDKERDIYAIDNLDGGVVGALRRLAVEAEAITDVIVTHLHFDHAGGLISADDDGRRHLTFPRARHHVQRRHLNWSRHASVKDRGSFRGDDIALLVRSGKLHVLDGDTEVVAGVEALVSEGHTVGQQLVRVRGGGRTLLFCADVIPTAAHLRLPWVMGYDIHPLSTIEEKQTILAQAVEEKWILCFEHDAEIVACTVGEEGDRIVPADVVR